MILNKLIWIWIGLLPNRTIVIGSAEGAEVEDEGGPVGRGLGGPHGGGACIYLRQLHSVALRVKVYIIILSPIDF